MLAEKEPLPEQGSPSSVSRPESPQFQSSNSTFVVPLGEGNGMGSVYRLDTMERMDAQDFARMMRSSRQPTVPDLAGALDGRVSDRGNEQPQPIRVTRSLGKESEKLEEQRDRGKKRKNVMSNSSLC